MCIASLQGNLLFAEPICREVAAKFSFPMQQFYRIFTATLPRAYHDDLPGIYREFFSFRGNFTAHLPRQFATTLPRVYRNPLSRIYREFATFIDTYLPRIYHEFVAYFDVYLPRIYLVFTANLLCIYRVFTAYLPHIYHVFIVYLLRILIRI
jgi:hypothetical protein